MFLSASSTSSSSQPEWQYSHLPCTISPSLSTSVAHQVSAFWEFLSCSHLVKVVPLNLKGKIHLLPR